MIWDLWFIETRDSRLSSCTRKVNIQHESAVFNSCFLIAREIGVPIDQEHLPSLLQGEPELIATVSLCHLDHEISHTNDLGLNYVAWGLCIVAVFGFHEKFRLALLRQGMIKVAAEILEYVVDRAWAGDKRVLAARCTINTIVILRTRIEDLDVLPFLSQALGRGVVQSLLKCDALLPFAEQPPTHCHPYHSRCSSGIHSGSTVPSFDHARHRLGDSSGVWKTEGSRWTGRSTRLGRSSKMPFRSLATSSITAQPIRLRITASRCSS